MQTSAQQSLSGPKGQVHALAVSEDGLLFAGTQVYFVVISADLWAFFDVELGYYVHLNSTRLKHIILQTIKK
jgi:hypothetical protein